MNDTANNFYEFDSFQVDVRRRLLMREGQPIRVTPKAFEILLALVRSGGRVLSKDEMMNTAWPDCFVEEGNLAQNVFLLRRTLGERKDEHKFIITIPGVGYRFAPYVKESTANPTLRTVTFGTDQKIGCIAVLPLKPVSQNETHPSLGVGFADALITKLSKLRIVRVMPTATMLRVVEPTQKPWATQNNPEVDALLDGLYQRDGEHLRVSVQLILAGAGTMVWAEKFDAEFTNLFELQDALSEQVATALAERLQGNGPPRLSVVRNRKKASLRCL
jgi:DNA-binding winged helix-turn-helix (wHTH) protein